MPTEQELHANPFQQFEVGNSVVWADDERNLFVAEKDTGDAGDLCETYAELVEATAE